MQRKIRRIETIKAFHVIRNLPGPLHPLVSLIDYGQANILPEYLGEYWHFDFFSIGLKKNVGTVRYGQQKYDFDEGLMSFIAPGQLLKVEPNQKDDVQPSGYLLLIHPDFIWNTSLATSITTYDFFDYAINEALFLSPKEEDTIAGMMENIREEVKGNIDEFSQHIIIAQIELLLKYAERFYQRQFITRRKVNHEVLLRVEQLLTDYFNTEALLNKGLPTVQYVAEELHLTPNYLSRLLKTLSGRSTQQHIHEKLIEKAKEKLSTSNFSVGEIAYQLGFEHTQSFSKLFKAKTQLSPVEFRQSFS